MAKAARQPRAGVSYITLITYERLALFEISRVASLFIETLLHYRTLGHYKLHAYVVLPDQVHLLITPQNITLDQAVNLIKQGFAHVLQAEHPVWSEAVTAHSVTTIHDLEVVRAHLHQLPVRAGLVAAAELYPHSSAFRATFAAHASATVIPASRKQDAERTSADSEPIQLRKVS